MLKLISATPSPYARKVRIVLAEKGIPFELITEVPWDSTAVQPARKATSIDTRTWEIYLREPYHPE